jgi:hypothetical protein
MASLAKSKSAQATVQHRARFFSPQRTALARHMNDAGAKASIGKRAVHELKEFLIIAAYFYVCFTALAYLKAAILEAQGIVFAPFGFPAVKVLICAKFLSIDTYSISAKGTGNNLSSGPRCTGHSSASLC